MKLRKWIAGVTCACMMLTLSPSAAVMAETMPQAATNAAARSTTGDFIVTGGTSGTDYSFENDTLTIKSSTPLTIKTNGETAQRIKAASNVQANITLSGVQIKLPSNVEEPAMDLHEAGASTVNLAAGTTNTLDASQTADNGPGLRTTKKGFVTINGPGTLTAKGGKKWPGIGGFAGDKQPGDVYTGEANIHITGGIIEASTATEDLAAAIGGSQRQGHPNIKITGGKVTAHGDIGPSPTVDNKAEFGSLTVSNAVVQVMSDTITKSTRHFSDCIVGRNLVEYNVYGNWTISEDVTLPKGKWLNVEPGGRLTIGAKATLTNEGGVHVWGNGTINADGALVRAGEGQYVVESGGKILNNTPPKDYGYTIVGNMVKAKPGYEISFDNSNWDEFQEFKMNTTYYIRKAGDLPTFGPSGSTTFSFSSDKQLPPPTVILDYVNETLSTDESMEYDTRLLGVQWPTCTKNMPLSTFNNAMHYWGNGIKECTVEIRTKARDGFLASEAVNITIPARTTAPTVGFSYKDGTIETNNTMEYRMSDNEGWTSCNGDLTILDEWFGKTVQIRTKAVQGQKLASFAQKLSIPAREVLTLTIDTAKEGVIVPNGYCYKVGGAQEWATSTGKLVTVAPGQSIEIVKPSTDSSFQSEVLTLTAPDRGAQPSVAFNYANETVTTTTEMQYCVDGGKWTDCTANMKIAEAWFGKNVQFRTKATAKNYASEAQSLNVPARNQAPSVAIDYSAETLGTTDAMEYRVGDSGDWDSCTENMSVVAHNWFDKDVQFRIKSTTNAFASAVNTVKVPTRLATPDLSIVNADEGVTIPRDHRYKIGDAQNWTDGTGELVKVEPGQTIVIYKPETDSNFKSLEQTLTAPAKGSAPSVTIDYANETVNTTDVMEYRVDSGKWTECTANMSVDAWTGKTVEFRTKATGSNYASDVQTLPVPARVQAPTVAIDYSAEILGTTTAMEYRVGDGQWNACTANMSVEAWFGKDVQFRIKATEDAFASETQTLSIAARPEAPSLELDNATEAVTISADYYYNTESAQYDNGKWKQGDGSAVQVGAEKTIYIYKAATKQAFKSQVQTLTAPSKGNAPNVTTNFDKETLSTTTAMEYRVGDSDKWTDCSADMKVTAFGWNGTADVAVQFRATATDKNYASDVQNVTIAQRPAAPTDVKTTHVSVVGRKDGALNGVTEAMEYKLDSEKSWTDCGGKEVHNLAAGTYQVRTKATDNAFASEVVTVTIKKGAQLAVDAVDLGKVAYGYEPQAHTITITNSGDCDATIESVAVSENSNFEVTGSGETVTAGGTLATYTIEPKAGLNAAAEKPYTDTITVTYNNGATATAEVKVTVIKADPIVQAPTANDLTYNSSEQALVTAGTTNGGTLEYRLGETGTYSTDVPKAMNAGPYIVYYRVVGNDNFNPAEEQSVSVTIKKAQQVVPAAPEAEKTTLYSITLKPVADANGVKAEYGIKDNDGNYQWQETPVFENLSSGTSYIFKVRYAESANYLGAESAEAVIHTSSRPTYPPIVPEVEGGEVIIKPSRPTSGQTVTITPKPNEGMEVDKVAVTDKNGNKIEVTQKPNGDFTFKQPSGKVTITVTFKPAVPSDFPFIDVPEDAWYRGAVEYVYNNGLIMGVAPNLFAPNMTTDRGQLVTMLWRLAGEPQAENSTGFNDVPSNAYYAKAVAWAAENGITAGFEDGSFRPTTGLSREQMAALFMKYAQAMGIDTTARADISGYTDVNPNSWSYEALSWAKAVGLLNGVGDATMAPQATATRAQIAAVLQRYCETIAK